MNFPAKPDNICQPPPPPPRSESNGRPLKGYETENYDFPRIFMEV